MERGGRLDRHIKQEMHHRKTYPTLGLRTPNVLDLCYALNVTFFGG